MSGAHAAVYFATSDTPPISLSEVPLDKVALHNYLREGKYKSWKAREGGRHPTRGPHTKFGVPVRVFLDDTLNASLSAGNDEHPSGSSAIKEMYTKDGELEGWAVMVKTSRESNGGKGWFWYEITSTTDPSMPVRIGNGVPLCYGCHAVGKDYVLTGYPLVRPVR